MNKNGWGLRAELGFILLFLICLIISSIGLSQFGLLKNGKYNNSNSNESYYILENDVAASAKKYYNRYYKNGADQTVIIGVKALITNGYINEVKDKYGNDCTGYAKILSNGTSQAYLSCKYYKTTGDDESNDY